LHESPTPLELLRERFGYRDFRRQQAAVIDHVCAGGDALVLMPTGGGKSLCYQIPALVRPGTGLVISPLIALMADQVAALERLGLRAAALNSTLSSDRRRQVEDDLLAGRLDLLYLAPERALQPDTLALLGAAPLSLIAIDEAHCVSAWGHDFRVDYLQLHALGAALPGVPRVALTATADPRTRDDIVRRLALEDPAIFVDGFDRPNIRYRVTPKADARRQLLAFLDDHRGEAGIVYCLSRKGTEATAEFLLDRGIAALPYHAGLDDAVRSRHQQRFLSEEGLVMVATVAFGMGIDKPDVRFVAHLDLPGSLEAYYQETGRAGRDGEPAEVLLLYGLQDVVRRSQLVNAGQASDEQKRIEQSKLDALLGWCEITRCRRQALLEYFGDRSLAEPCGNCDVCLTPPSTWDATEAAQKALSAVYRTGQRFGAGHLIDVLRGADTEKVRKFGHDRLSVYGIGADLADARWRTLLRQLVVRGFLLSDPERFGALRLTAASRPVLRGEARLELRQDDVESGRRRERRRGAADTLEGADRALWEALRARRKALAEEEGVPPYVVFHDATLMEMVRLRPHSAAELLELNGVGRAKLERFGEPFLEIIRETAAAAPERQEL